MVGLLFVFKKLFLNTHLNCIHNPGLYVFSCSSARNTSPLDPKKENSLPLQWKCWKIFFTYWIFDKPSQELYSVKCARNFASLTSQWCPWNSIHVMLWAGRCFTGLTSRSFTWHLNIEKKQRVPYWRNVTDGQTLLRNWCSQAINTMLCT